MERIREFCYCWAVLLPNKLIQRSADSKLTQRVIPHRMVSCSAYKAQGRRKAGHSEWWLLFSKGTFCMMEPWFLGGGWTPVCTWEMVNLFCFAFLVCTFTVSHLIYSFNYFPHPPEGEVTEWPCGPWLPARVNLQLS